MEDNIYSELGIIVDSAQWFEWLSTINGFRYEPSSVGYMYMRSGITCIRLKSSYWSAVRKVNQKQRTFYLGKTEDITYQLLQDAVDELSLSATKYEASRASKKKQKLNSESSRLLTTQSQTADLEQRNKQLQMQLEQVTQDNNRLQLQLEEVQQQLSAKKELQQLQAQYSQLDRRHQEMKVDFFNLYSKVLLEIKPGYTANSGSKLVKEIKAIFSKHLEVPLPEEQIKYP